MGVESDPDELSDSSAKKSSKSILESVSERMEESTAMGVPDTFDVPESEGAFSDNDRDST